MINVYFIIETPHFARGDNLIFYDGGSECGSKASAL
jgi:hypothetical protein